MTSSPKLRLLLWDHLSQNISSLEDLDKESDIVVFLETREEATYVKHHPKKLVFLWSAQRHFAKQLEDEGVNVVYVDFDDPDNTHKLTSELERLSADYELSDVVVTRPGDFRTYEALRSMSHEGLIHLDMCEDNRFYCSVDQFSSWAESRKSLMMEYFYRQMRKDHNVFMDDDEPVGGEWNYDKDNRKPAPKEIKIPEPFKLATDQTTKDVIKLVDREFSDHFGNTKGFSYAVTRSEALKALDLFISERLENFGSYQDAMLEEEPWMFHSHISFYLNAGLLEARECVEAAEQAYKDGNAPVNAVEGFIRQILGWREYVRGIYWLMMPGYKDKNFLKAKGKLPKFFWDAESDMNCLNQCITETKDNAYAHHIQRLMVLGNFCLIAGIDPKYVNEWYMIVYADAHEWVELPNVTGMILFADGGFLGSKPYAASGAYIDKMSNYCQSCKYNVKDKLGKTACPFNYLYWDFLDRNEDTLKSNRRLSMIYGTLRKMKDDKRDAIRKDAESFLKSIGVR